MTNSWRFSHFVLQDEFAVARLMALELKARLPCDQGLKKRFALDERQIRDFPGVKVQEIEAVKDDPRIARAVGHSLGVGEARQSGVVKAAELAVDVGGLQRALRWRLDILAVQSSPVRVRSCARPLSMRAAMR
jgi:hypothetical protein